METNFWRRPKTLTIIATGGKMKILAILFILTSCGNYSETKGVLEDSFSRNLDAPIDFETINEAIIQPHCISCHQQYSTYDGVKNEANSILNAVTTNRMPKNTAPLSNSKKELLAAWVAAGTPLGTDAPPPVNQKLEATWVSLSSKVFFPKCLVCHNPQGQAKFLDLSSRQAFFEQRDRDFGGEKLLNFEQPEESYLISVINDPFEPMPPIWSNIEQLKPEEVEVIIEWIEKGLP